MNVILCGMPGSGKSHYGKIAAEKLGLNFIDTDELVMAEYFKSHGHHATCREIALREGEHYFRSLESEIIKGLKHSKKSIIAIGGGALNLQENITILKEIGWLLYLKTSPKVLLERLMQKPSLPSYLDKDAIEKSFTTLLEQRLPIYEKNCHRSIDTASENVVELIKNHVCKENHHGE
jgi:shikimate kinase